MRVALPLAALALLATPAPAVATKPRTIVHRAHEGIDLFAEGSNGYTVLVAGFSPHKALVLVEKPPQSVLYELPALIDGNRFEAHFGDVIDVSVSFQAERRRVIPGAPGQRCSGRKPESLYGTFVGTIEFHGELGFTELVSTERNGTRDRYFRRVCRPVPRAAASTTGPPARQLVVARPEGSSETWFRALTGIAAPKAYPQWIFEARHTERIGPVSIRRQALVEAETGATLSALGITPTTAAVSPPAPFFGSAEYVEGAGPGSWTGSLGVELPGVPPVPLTGEGFDALTCVDQGRCGAAVPPPGA
jgi:hypothetical protein